MALSICAITSNCPEPSSNGKPDSGPENPITGVEDGFIVPRQNIYDMEQDGDLWNIYILGLLQMQNKDQRDPLSYYRIACESYSGINEDTLLGSR